MLVPVRHAWQTGNRGQMLCWSVLKMTPSCWSQIITASSEGCSALFNVSKKSLSQCALLWWVQSVNEREISLSNKTDKGRKSIWFFGVIKAFWFNLAVWPRVRAHVGGRGGNLSNIDCSFWPFISYVGFWSILFKSKDQQITFTPQYDTEHTGKQTKVKKRDVTRGGKWLVHLPVQT